MSRSLLSKLAETLLVWK